MGKRLNTNLLSVCLPSVITCHAFCICSDGEPIAHTYFDFLIKNNFTLVIRVSFISNCAYTFSCHTSQSSFWRVVFTLVIGFKYYVTRIYNKVIVTHKTSFHIVYNRCKDGVKYLNLHFPVCDPLCPAPSFRIRNANSALFH